MTSAVHYLYPLFCNPCSNLNEENKTATKLLLLGPFGNPCSLVIADDS